MIEAPKRSVTRFFIPLIDVLTLLFCVFLVMPLTRPNSEEGSRVPMSGKELLDQYYQDREKIRKLEEDLAKIQDRQGVSLQKRLAVRVLEIDGESGDLYYYNPEKRPIRDQAAAESLIANDQRVLAASRRELLYIVLFPRDRDSDRPTTEQRERYERWFENVQVRFDKPGDGPENR